MATFSAEISPGRRTREPRPRKRFADSGVGAKALEMQCVGTVRFRAGYRALDDQDSQHLNPGYVKSPPPARISALASMTSWSDHGCFWPIGLATAAGRALCY